LNRAQQLHDWLQQHFDAEPVALAPASEDASFRRYFRATTPRGTFVVMDAPPERENCGPFLHVASLFAAAGVHVPAVLAQNLKDGFLLLSDLGTQTYLQRLDQTTAPQLYDDANRALVRIQCASRLGELPGYDRELLTREMNLFPDWYVARHLRTALSPAQNDVLREVYKRILANNLGQPQVYVHRDYHSRNLMVSDPNPGILDFQDAVYGPITYDLVSLYKDAYVAWDEERVLDWVIRYWEQARAAGLPVLADFSAFYRDFEWMGVQRHLKVLGIFARLNYRDGKGAYLKDLPLVMRYLRDACARYAALHPLLRLLDQLEQRQTGVDYTF
jgi:aminoglycoside/choline kinase family phosphotransferase